MKTARFLLLAGFLFLFTIAPQAQAYVSEWNYSIESIFVNSTFDQSTIQGLNTITQSKTKLAWGLPTDYDYYGNHYSYDKNDRSSIVIAPSKVSDTVDTYVGVGNIADFWADSVEITHNNNPIYAGTGSLTSTTIKTTVSLTPSGSKTALPSFNYFFNVAFLETPNDSKYPNDIFVLLSGLQNISFLYGGDSYFVNIFPTDSGAFSTLGAYGEYYHYGANAIGFTTEEGQSTSVPFAFTISTTALSATSMASTPEPSTLLLLGFGMVGLAGIARRKLNKNK